MPSPNKHAGTPAERERREQAQADKLAALHERLAQQVAALRTGDDWRRWLEVASRFHDYSFNNTLLICAQRPHATLVAGYEAWRALGRQVEKGQRGIQILAPVIRRDRDGAAAEVDRRARDQKGNEADAAGDEEERRRRVVGFRATYVWDVSQTFGELLPAQPRPQLLEGQAPPGLWDGLAQLVADHGFALERGDCGTANGVTNYVTRTVRVRADVDDAQAAKTLAHELAHVLLHDPAGSTAGASPVSPRTSECGGVLEVEAESVAYLVSAARGLSTDRYTFPYVTTWAAGAGGKEPEDVVRETGARVLSAARAVLAATPSDAPLVDPALAEQVQAGVERAAVARGSAEATLAEATRRRELVDLDALARLHADATGFYRAQLHAGTPDAARAREMLDRRGVTAAAVDGYELGYAQPGWTALVDHMRARGWTDDEMIAAGVAVISRRATPVDRFRDRLMFPVREPSGERIIAFVGRALHEQEGTPKYLNSPETALYRKGDVLYGLGATPVREALAAGAVPVLVEGPFDAIAVTSAGGGSYAGVAVSGTALTRPHVGALESAAGCLAQRGVIVVFDADDAGRAAAERAFGLLRTVDAWPMTADLPEREDPASLRNDEGDATLRTALDTRRPLADLVIDECINRWSGRLQWVEGRLAAARDAATVIATLPAEHIAPQVLRVAERLELPAADVTREVVDAFTADATVSGRGHARRATGSPGSQALLSSGPLGTGTLERPVPTLTTRRPRVR